MNKLPTRKPDFYVAYLTCGFLVSGWQEKNHFVLLLPDEENQVIVAGNGNYDELCKYETFKEELSRNFFRAILNNFYKKQELPRLS